MAESKSDVDDPYGFILELAYISPSQEQLLQNAPFVGAISETPSFFAEDTPPEVKGSQGKQPEIQPQSGNTLEKKDVFDVLRVVSEFSNNDDDDVVVEDNLSLLELVRSRGITFPRPRFWLDCHNSNWLFDDN